MSMKRTRTPMRRTAFRKEGPTLKPAREWTGEYRPERPSAVMARCDAVVRAVPKENASQSGPYMRAAKGLGYCMRCGVQVVPMTGALDFCHADLGKGTGIKTDVRLGWPGCRFCHETVGREMLKPVRRAVELLLGVMTRAAVIEAGTWPAKLPMWDVEMSGAAPSAAIG